MNIEERVKSCLEYASGFDAESMRNDLDLYDNIGFDSIDAVESLMELEDEFGMEIPDLDAEKWKTVQDVIDYVTQRVKSTV